MAKMIAQFRSFHVHTLKTDAKMSVKPECVFDGDDMYISMIEKA